MRIKILQTFLGVWIRNLSKPFEVWGGATRDSLVDDCVSALQLAAQSDSAIGEVYNLGGCGQP